MIHGHGDDHHLYTNIAFDFSSNVNPYGISSELQQHLAQNIFKVTHYPEPIAQSLARTIETKKSLAFECVLVTNGATESIYIIAQHFSGKNSLIFQPTFSEYEDACKQYKHTIEFGSFKHFNETNFKEHDLVWICNPNNPTGEVTSPTILLERIKEHPHTTFIVDEAYIEFCSAKFSIEEEAGKLENLIVLKSMTKLYAMPGIRLGFMIASPKLLKIFEKHLMPWRVNQLAIVAGLHCFKNDRINTLNLNELLAASKQLQENINKIDGFKAHSSNTPFFLVECPVKASVIKDFLIKKHGILVRDASNFRGLNEYHIRIATQKYEANLALINALKLWK